MRCYIERVCRQSDVISDVKQLIPDAGLRRRMSRVVKSAVATGVECVGGVEHIEALDAIVTATGWGCLADSERFLRNVIVDKEQLLNPTPFIQSTFNTVGGQIALLKHNHCYNVTYVNRSHSFEDALLDVLLRIADAQSENVLLGAFDEQTPSQQRIMERMGLFRKCQCGEGAVFALVTAKPTERSVAQVSGIEFPAESIFKEQVAKRYGVTAEEELMYNRYAEYGLYPTASAQVFAEAVERIQQGVERVVVYNEYLGDSPTIIELRCIG
ncbi:MAG: beta-ketoacyl synthase chain length factor [Alistipes sp.]|nr:beta-ketoacyl synthase chain length factor [Alistipes sp.]